MQKSLLLKAALVLVVLVLVAIPLQMIRGLVLERGARQHAMEAELAASSWGRQAITGPLLTIPYVDEIDDETLPDGRRMAGTRIERTLTLFPLRETHEGTASVDVKTRGIFEVRTFEWRARIAGEFAGASTGALERTRPDSRITWGIPTLSIILADPRGLSGMPRLTVNGQQVAFERGTALAAAPSGLHARLAPWSPRDGTGLTYGLELAVHGTGALSIVPLAADARVAMRSGWAHAGFGGQFLPDPATVERRADGFAARWSVSALASNAQEQAAGWLGARGACRQIGCVDHLEVRFVEPVDIYALSDRATKYGVLFIACTFIAFVLVELVRALRIHPAQYLLVGLAQATFFLLLLALSEHVAFALAYAIGAVASIGVLTYYLTAVLGGVRRGMAFASLLGTLYAALYGLLVSEDNALLLGALLVFALVATLLVLTRRLDWYALGRGSTADTVPD
jgi:inner membrane protein